MFPLGLIGIMIAHLHRTVGGQQTNAKFVKSVAILLSVRGASEDEMGKVMVQFDKKHHSIEWTVRATKGMVVTHMQRCLRAFEECLDDPLRQIRIRHAHYLKADCELKLDGCGEKGGVEFELKRDWVMGAETKVIPNLEGKCSCGFMCHLRDCRFGPEVVSPRFSQIPNDVVIFVSHTGEQKECVARPLQKSLEENGQW